MGGLVLVWRPLIRLLFPHFLQLLISQLLASTLGLTSQKEQHNNCGDSSEADKRRESEPDNLPEPVVVDNIRFYLVALFQLVRNLVKEDLAAVHAIRL